MPKNLFLVRHGESEGNIAFRAMKKGDEQYITNSEFQAQHSSRWRLTPDGRKQAEQAGVWIKENISDIDYLFTSEYARAIETAGLLDLNNGESSQKRWRITPYLRERNWGELDRLSESTRQELYASNIADADITPYYWKPPNGEALVEVSARLRLWIDTLHRINPQSNVLCVCHGEVIESIRIELERLTEHDFEVMKEKQEEKIKNCSIVHYTRIHPETGDEAEYFTHRRIISLDDDPKQDFREINRKTYSSEELLEIVKRSPNFFSS